jgi:hypothetical protein
LTATPRSANQRALFRRRSVSGLPRSGSNRQRDELEPEVPEGEGVAPLLHDHLGVPEADGRPRSRAAYPGTVMDFFWNAVWSLTPTVLVGGVFWFILWVIIRSDRHERKAQADIEAQELARLRPHDTAS